MKILFVSGYYKPSYIYGGPARSIPLLCEAMARIGAQITVFTTNANGPGRILDVPINQPQDVDGIKVYYFPVSWPWARFFPFFSPELGQACERLAKQFDVGYIAGDWTHPGFKGAQAFIQAKVPYVMSPRGSLMTWSMREKALKKHLYLALVEKRLINSANAIHTTSSLEAHQLQKWHFKPPTITIPNGIDFTPFNNLPQRGKLRKFLNIPGDCTLSLFVGRLHKEKRLDLIISAFGSFAQQSQTDHLLIVGSDQDGSGKRAEEQVRELRLGNQVHFTGMLIGGDLIQAYIDSDMLVLMSFRENFGMVVLEAMATGLPVLLAKEVGLAAEVEQANAGIVVNDSPGEIGTAWARILSNKNLRDEMGERGKQLVRERFSSEIVASRMLELFASISGKG